MSLITVCSDSAVRADSGYQNLAHLDMSAGGTVPSEWYLLIGVPFGIASNKLIATQAQNNVMYPISLPEGVPLTSVGNQQGQIVTWGDTSGIVLRIDSTEHYVFFLRTAGGVGVIYHHDDSGFTPLFTCSGTIVDGDTMRFAIVDGTLKAFVNDVLVGSCSDPEPDHVGVGGIYLASPTTGMASDFVWQIGTAATAVAAKLAVSSQPTTSVSERVSDSVSLVVQSSTGTLISTDTRQIRLSLVVLSGSARIVSGSVTKNAVGGGASFDDLLIECTEDAAWTYFGEADGLSSVTSAPITGSVWSPDCVVTPA